MATGTVSENDTLKIFARYRDNDFHQITTAVVHNDWSLLIPRGIVTLESRTRSRCGKILSVMEGAKTIITLLGDLATFFWLTLRPRSTFAAENLFLRKQLVMHQERKAKPRPPDTPIRIMLVLLSRIFNWRDALIVAQPQSIVRWHRQGLRLFWRW